MMNYKKKMFIYFKEIRIALISISYETVHMSSRNFILVSTFFHLLGSCSFKTSEIFSIFDTTPHPLSEVVQNPDRIFLSPGAMSAD